MRKRGGRVALGTSHPTYSNTHTQQALQALVTTTTTTLFQFSSRELVLAAAAAEEKANIVGLIEL